uniref:Endo/exonuclease/phosphatase domain-containing protein n=1 Tax=Haemonchus contortus TaxID=6289 RepID=A0A7I4Z2K6_HAECO
MSPGEIHREVEPNLEWTEHGARPTESLAELRAQLAEHAQELAVSWASCPKGEGLGWRAVLSTHGRLHRKRVWKIKYDVIGLTETRRHRPLHAIFETGEELFLATRDSRGVGGVGVLANTHLATNIDSYESLTTRIGRLRSRRCGSTQALTIFVAYAPTSSYEEEELEAFYMDLERLYRDDHTFFKVIVGDFNAKFAPKGGLKSFTLGLTEWNGMSRMKGCPTSSCPHDKTPLQSLASYS